MVRLRPALVAGCLLAALALDARVRAGGSGQSERDGHEPARPAGAPIFRSGTNLATIDVVVTDGDGRHITDLTRDDFEVSVSGDRQVLRQAVYVRTIASQADGAGQSRTPSGTPVPSSVPAATPRAGAVLTPPSPVSAGAVLRRSGLRPDQISRTIAIVVDDLGLSFESTAYVRNALRKFIDTQMRPGDLVAIIRTGAGVGALQQFTVDRRLLHEAADRVQWNFMSRSLIGAFAPITPTPLVEDGGKHDILRTDVMSVGSLGAIEYISRGVRHLPGRKAIVLFSEGFPSFFEDRREGGRVWKAMTRMLDEANRAGVVINTIDPRGLQTGGLTAEDNPVLRDFGPLPGSGGGAGSAAGDLSAGAHVSRTARDRLNELFRTQEALRFIATQTGGLSITTNNDLNLGISRILDDLQGYYLLGYDIPHGELPSGWDQGRVKVRVKRPGLRVRSRQGFFGPVTEAPVAPPTDRDRLLTAALSPFTSGDMAVRLTALFGHDPDEGSYLRSMLFVDANDVTFTRTAEGRHEAQLEMSLFAVGDNGELAGEWRRELPIVLTDEQLRRTKSAGIVYNARLKVGKPGGYQLRAAVLDRASQMVGSGSQFVEVPKVGKGQLAMSSVLMKGVDPGNGTAGTVARGLAASALLEPTVRILAAGSLAAYACEVYDGVRGPGTLSLSTSLLKDGRLVYRSPATPVTVDRKDRDVRVIPIGGSLSLGNDVPPGAYSLQVTVSRVKDGRTERYASQWVDFEVR